RPRPHTPALHDALPISARGARVARERRLVVLIREPGDGHGPRLRVQVLADREVGVVIGPLAARSLVARPSEVLDRRADAGDAVEDRKSTRLNSSHVKIS